MSRLAHCASRSLCRSYPAMGIAGYLLIAWSLVPLVLMTAATAAAPYLEDRG
jgi:hypothetical protein